MQALQGKHSTQQTAKQALQGKRPSNRNLRPPCTTLPPAISTVGGTEGRGVGGVNATLGA